MIRFALMTICLFTFVVPSVAIAQLRISEVMYDTAANEGAWEWFELVNASDVAIDLDGYVFDDFSISNNAQTEPNILNVTSGGNAAVTEIPAGGLAVIYNGGSLEFDDSRFRSAWRLDSTVTLIGVSSFESLNNSGDTFGLWRTLDDYAADLANTDDDEQLEVTNFAAAAAWIDYAAEGFPSAKNASIAWNGEGNYQDGANWFASTEESQNVFTSMQTFLATSPLNSQNDLASPGITNAVGEPNGLVITEILYNPASSEPAEWEFVEVLNGTGATIDFNATPYVLDDKASGPLSEANIDSGSISDGEVAVLFRDSTSLEQMQSAWGENINFIPVGAWSALNNGDDTLGIWSSLDAYNLDSPADGDRTYGEAITSLTYGVDGWPVESDGQSISLVDVEVDQDEPTNWIVSSPEDSLSRSPELVFSSTLIDHEGGDLGTPGQFGDIVLTPVDPPNGEFDLDINDDDLVNSADAPLLCEALKNADIDLAAAVVNGEPIHAQLGLISGDVDLNGTVEFADFLILSSSFGGTGLHYGLGDQDCDGNVSFADFLALSSNFGQSIAVSAAVPEPSGDVFVFLALAGVIAFFTRDSTLRRAAVAK